MDLLAQSIELYRGRTLLVGSKIYVLQARKTGPEECQLRRRLVTMIMFTIRLQRWQDLRRNCDGMGQWGHPAVVGCTRVVPLNLAPLLLYCTVLYMYMYCRVCRAHKRERKMTDSARVIHKKSTPR